MALAAAALGRQMPAQMRRAGFTRLPVAQKKQRGASLGGPQSQPPAGGKIERLRHRPNLGDNACNRTGGQRLLARPEQLGHVAWSHDDQTRRIQPETEKTRAIGQPEKPAILGQLQIEQGRALGSQQPPALPQREGKAGPAIARRICEHLLHEPATKGRKRAVSAERDLLSCLGEDRLPLDIGNDIPQRGKALLLNLGLHDATSYVNKERTFRLQISAESSPFRSPLCDRCASTASRPREERKSPLSRRDLSIVSTQPPPARLDPIDDPTEAAPMFEALTRLFGKTEAPADLRDPKLAVAALLVHLAAVDGTMEAAERAAIRTALMDHYDLDEASVDKLVQEAARQDAEAVDFYKFTSGLTQLDMDDRIEVIRMMWTVVFADDKNHELEDNMVWRIAELIGVSSRDRTILRNQVRQAGAGQ